MTAPTVTAFTETAALWALMNADVGEVWRLVDDMFPGERDEFAGQLSRLLGMLGAYCGECAKHVGDSRKLVTLVRRLGGPRQHVCQECAADLMAGPNGSAR